MCRISACLLVGGLSFVTTAAAQQAPASRPKATLLVVPFAAVSPEVPPRAGHRAAGMLAAEFRSGELFEVSEATRAQLPDPYAETLAASRAAVEVAKEERAKKKFSLAHDSLIRALTGFRAAAGGLTDLSEVIDAYALLAAVQFNTGKDEEGHASLDTVLGLSPQRELPLAQTSPLFAAVVAKARKALTERPTGSLLIESTPSNAAVSLDGRALGSTPLVVREVPPGLHFWRAQLPSGDAVGGVVEVPTGKQAQVMASSSRRDAETRLLSAVAMNRLDPEAVRATTELAQSVKVDFVVFGGLSREGKELALDAFLLVAHRGELRRLKRARFDSELLSAGMEFLALAGEVAKQGRSAGEAVKVPTPVSLALVGASTKASEASYGRIADQGTLSPTEEPATAVTAEPRKPLRKPLQPKKP